MDGTALALMASALWAQQSPLGLLLVRVDEFAAYTAFHGEGAASACWEQVHRCLLEQLRGTTDRVSLLAPGTVAVLMPGVGESAGSDVGERLRAGIEALAIPHLGLVPAGLVSVSVGVASLMPSPGRKPVALFAAAEQALRAGRRDGGNCVRIGRLERVPADGNQPGG